MTPSRFFLCSAILTGLSFLYQAVNVTLTVTYNEGRAVQLNQEIVDCKD